MEIPPDINTQEEFYLVLPNSEKGIPALQNQWHVNDCISWTSVGHLLLQNNTTHSTFQRGE